MTVRECQCAHCQSCVFIGSCKHVHHERHTKQNRNDEAAVEDAPHGALDDALQKES